MDYWQEFIRTGHVSDYLKYKLDEDRKKNNTKKEDKNDKI